MLDIKSNIEKRVIGFRQLRKMFGPFVRDGAMTLSRKFVSEIKEYPPETEANSPPPPYWNRGAGLVNKNGSVYPKSKDLKGSWEINETSNNIIIENKVTYAPWVHGTRTQAEFHGKRGWPKISDILKRIGLKGEEQGTTVITNQEPAARNMRAKIMRKIRSIFA